MKNLTLLSLLIGFCASVYAQHPYYPLKKGAVYTYAYSKTFYEGQGIDVSKMNMHVKTLNETKAVNGNTYMITETSTGMGTDALRSYIRQKPDGSVAGMTEGEKTESIFLPASPSKGDTWTSSTGGAKAKVTIIDLDGSIRTPLKDYTGCLVMESSQDGMATRSYFQKGVGLVAISMVIGGDEKLFVFLSQQG
jgi:hypothetical protein